jgi:hypothetical protein
MDDDFNNVVVLTVFAGCLVTVIVGYLLAWRSKRTRYRKAGSLVTAAVAGFAGLVMSAWLMGAVTPFHHPMEVRFGNLWFSFSLFRHFPWVHFT